MAIYFNEPGLKINQEAFFCLSMVILGNQSVIRIADKSEGKPFFPLILSEIGDFFLYSVVLMRYLQRLPDTAAAGFIDMDKREILK